MTKHFANDVGINRRTKVWENFTYQMKISVFIDQGGARHVFSVQH